MLLGTALAHPSRAASLEAMDRAPFDSFGTATALSGPIGLIAAYADGVDDNEQQGSVYVFRDLHAFGGTRTHDAKLIASDGAEYDSLGSALGFSGNLGLAGAYGDDSYRGSAYLFRDLHTANGLVTENAKLTASDRAQGDFFGSAVALAGTTGLVGAPLQNVDGRTDQGAAYLFRQLDIVTSAITQNAKLFASDGAEDDRFGSAVSLTGTLGLVGAPNANIAGISDQGAAYLFRDLGAASGLVNQHAKLVAPDGATETGLGTAVSLSGTMALAGAPFDLGAVFLYRNLETATGTLKPVARLSPTGNQTGDAFGHSVSLSGSDGLVGAFGATVDGRVIRGAAHLFRNLGSAAGTVNQNVMILASDGTDDDRFGSSVSLEGDTFLIGAEGADNYRGRAYTGSVSSLTTLDGGNTDRIIDGIDFSSRDHWIVGDTTDDNSVDLSEGSTARITAAGKSVFIGRSSGSDNNTLVVRNRLVTDRVYIGGPSNQGNVLRLEEFGDIQGAGAAGANYFLSPGNAMIIDGDHQTFSALAERLNDGRIHVPGASPWAVVTSANISQLLTITLNSGYTVVSVASLAPPPVIGGSATASGRQGNPFSYQIVATPQPASFLANGLPPGLAINPATGAITGVPSKSGTFTVTVGATNAGGTGTRSVKFTIARENRPPVLAVTTPSSMRAVTTAAGSYVIRGNAKDNFRLAKLKFRLIPPADAKKGSFTSKTLTGKSAKWNIPLKLKTRGTWSVEIIAVDGAGNSSKPIVVRVTRK